MPRLSVIVLSLLLIFAIQLAFSIRAGDRTASSPASAVSFALASSSSPSSSSSSAAAQSSSSNRKETYIHQRESYRLNEAHKENRCVSCHPKSQRRRGGCASCHEQRHDLPAGLTCTTCHTLESFSQIKNYRHLLNDFLRVGVHKTLSCRECHPNGQFKGNPRECVHCHMDRVQDSPHGMKLGGDCQQCHAPYGWQPVRPQHTRFPLQGAHRSLDCLDCHPGYEFKNVQSYCYTCHKREFHGSRGLNHVAAGFSYDCLLCHTINSFIPSSWRHPAGLASEGNHRSAACLDCHKQGIFSGLSDVCQSCHQKDYAATVNPNHPSSGFPLDCTLCHKPQDPSWESAVRNHTWPLRGVHKTLACTDCHKDGVYAAGKSTLCFSCHQADYEGTRNPDHQASGYPTTCDSCHHDSDISWDQAVFDHPLPLTSNHAGIACTECHKDPADYAVFVCTDCHQRQETARIHRGVSGYNYNSQFCYNCHPHGRR